MTDMQLLWIASVSLLILIAGLSLYVQTLLLQKHVPRHILTLHQKTITLVTMVLLTVCAGYAVFIWLNRPATKVRVPVTKSEWSMPQMVPLNVVPSIQKALLKDVYQRMLSDKQLHCMALNVYHEARGEQHVGNVYDRTLSGPELVAEVTLYRAHRNHVSLCSVVYADNQFSWTQSSVSVRDQQAFQRAKHLARARVLAYLEGHQPLKISHFHATHVYPKWTKNMKLVADVGGHRFWYKEG